MSKHNIPLINIKKENTQNYLKYNNSADLSQGLKKEFKIAATEVLL